MSEEFFTTEDGVRRPSTPEEIAAVKELRKKLEIQEAEINAKAEQKQAILDRLGLTADEAKLLLG